MAREAALWSAGANGLRRLLAAKPPDGWQMRPSADGSGVVVAQAAGNLDAALSSGPRLTVMPVPQGAPDPAALVDSIASAPLVGQVSTTTTTIAGRSVVAVEWTESGLGGEQTYREIVANLGAGRAYSVVMEAPASAWRPPLRS